MTEKRVAAVSFVASINGRKYRAIGGAEIEVPEGADWERAGLLVPIRVEMAVVGPLETAVVGPLEMAVVGPLETAESHGDDLTVIKGIGPATAEDLASFGVGSFVALAGADSVSLAGRLNGSSARQVAGWIEQAKALVI